MTEPILRTFFGFELPADIPRRVSGLRTLVHDPKQAVRWVKGGNIHLTVRFLGATPKSAVDEIAAAMGDKLRDFKPFEVTVEGTGVFPPAARRPRVLWMGVKGQIDQLQVLEGAIHQVVGPMGFPREEREFTPHITLGRVKYPQKIVPDVGKFLHAEYEPVVCYLKALHLYESRPGDKGIVYTSLATFPFQTIDQEGT